jgi:dinuclear metal center YbgI/SA1388 family protein
VSTAGGYGRPMPTSTAEILAHLDELLEPGRFEDYCPNGLQVPGPAEVQTIATGVSASAELFGLAARERADLLIVHHGLFWGKSAGAIDAQLKRRLQLLFEADIGLAAYHLPLDAHPTLGNNALLADALGAERDEEEPFALHHGEPIGRLARFSGEGVPAQELIERVREATGGRAPLVFDAGPPRVRMLAIVSGAGSDYLAEAARAGADALLTGEPAERAMAQARELGVWLIAAGHYATETHGVRALGEHLAGRHGLRHVFLDVPNPV